MRENGKEAGVTIVRASALGIDMVAGATPVLLIEDSTRRSGVRGVAFRGFSESSYFGRLMPQPSSDVFSARWRR